MNQGPKIMIFLSAALLMLASIIPQAAARTPTPEQAQEAGKRRFQSFDQNQDGKITLEEYLYLLHAETPSRKQFLEFEFRKFDRNGDGFITFEEFSAAVTLKDEFRALDKNQDGRISRDEFLQGKRMFGRLDRNHDGFISLEEYLDGYRYKTTGK